MNKKFKYFSLLLIIPVIILILTNQDQDGQNPQTDTSDGSTVSPSFGTSADLSISHPPKLAEEAQLTFTIQGQPWENAMLKSITANIVLPEGFALVNGDLSWNGDLGTNQTVQIISTIKAVKTGDWTIGADLKGAMDFLYITVSEDGASLSDEPFVVPRSSSLAETITIQNESQGG